MRPVALSTALLTGALAAAAFLAPELSHRPAPDEGEAPGTSPPRPRPAPPAAEERIQERLRMLRQQISHPADGRSPVRSEKVIEAMRVVPRHAFVPAKLAREAYADSPLPIGSGQTISQPYIVAWMTELLEVEPGAKVLEIGTGSGYQAAVLAHLTPRVYTVEIIEELQRQARATLEAQGYSEVQCRRGDGYFGWPEKGPFAGIIVTCATGHLPPPLWEQLQPGGRIVIPLGGPYEVQRLVVVTKTAEGKRRSRTIALVRFVPFTGPGIVGKGKSEGAPEVRKGR